MTRMHADEVETDVALVRRLLPLALPVQLVRGRPAEGYPFEWSVYEWLPGENANGTIGDLEQAAVDLAGFVRALRRVDTTGAHPRHPHGRGGPLAQHDEHVRRSVAGDPACDLQPAWNLFAGPSRARFRDELAVDDASWLRGRGWALFQAVVALPYYWDTTPAWSGRPPTPSPRCSPTGPRASGAACCAGPCPPARGR